MQVPMWHDEAALRMAKQLRRYKNRLRDHHARLEQTPESEMSKARDYTLAVKELEGVANDEEEDDIPHGKIRSSSLRCRCRFKKCRYRTL